MEMEMAMRCKLPERKKIKFCWVIPFNILSDLLLFSEPFK